MTEVLQTIPLKSLLVAFAPNGIFMLAIVTQLVLDLPRFFTPLFIAT